MGRVDMRLELRRHTAFLVLAWIAIVSHGSLEQDGAVTDLGGDVVAAKEEKAIEEQVRTQAPDAAAFDVNSADQANRIDAALTGVMGKSSRAKSPAPSQASLLKKELAAIDNFDTHTGVSIGESGKDSAERCGDELGESGTVSAGCEKKQKLKKKVNLRKKNKRNKTLETAHKRRERVTKANVKNRERVSKRKEKLRKSKERIFKRKMRREKVDKRAAEKKLKRHKEKNKKKIKIQKEKVKKSREKRKKANEKAKKLSVRVRKNRKRQEKNTKARARREKKAKTFERGSKERRRKERV